jgi:D-methionine transport system ATP-binding protein
LDTFTVKDNILLPLVLSKVSVKQMELQLQPIVQTLGIADLLQHYPYELSGGQKQRVGIARALANEPEILLCDEATSALDPQTTEEVLDLLLSINKKLHLTIVLITHEMNVIRKICNKVAVMEHGQIVEEGSVQSVFRNPQQEVTKRFVQQDLEPEEDVEELRQAFLRENPQGHLVTLTFTQDNANEPVISQAIRRFQIDVNVVYGKIQQTNEGSFGGLTVLLTGEASEVEKAIAFFKEQQVGVEVIERG